MPNWLKDLILVALGCSSILLAVGMALGIFDVHILRG